MGRSLSCIEKAGSGRRTPRGGPARSLSGCRMLPAWVADCVVAESSRLILAASTRWKLARSLLIWLSKSLRTSSSRLAEDVGLLDQDQTIVAQFLCEAVDAATSSERVISREWSIGNIASNRSTISSPIVAWATACATRQPVMAATATCRMCSFSIRVILGRGGVEPISHNPFGSGRPDDHGYSRRDHAARSSRKQCSIALRHAG